MINTAEISHASTYTEAVNRAYRGHKYRTRERLQFFADNHDADRRVVITLEHWSRFSDAAKAYKTATDEQHTIRVRTLSGWTPDSPGSESGCWTIDGDEHERDITPKQSDALRSTIHAMLAAEFSAAPLGRVLPGSHYRTSKGAAVPLPLPEGIAI